MPTFVEFDTLASREYLKARRWYAARASEQIAAAMAEEVDRVMVRIAESPAAGTVFQTRYHWVRLQRFPYIVYYRIVSPDTLVVLAFAHERPRPRYRLRQHKN